MHKDPFYKSLGYAISGIIQCIQKERNIKIHLVFMFLVIICGFLFQLSITEWLVCILLFGLVISLELVNTAIEAVVDLCTQEYHPLAKIAKDTAAGAVLISAIASVVIGLIIFVPKILSLVSL
ncbi:MULTISPECIES: diacylglycerol kinase family protein [unclassified Massilimicrobiota]|jgi:diacylglycerol kinase|uniref:diacylglycerol kinase family protein n=1 Tax=Bacillota TaxID=1239 RepID=UPI000B449459|nr:MULTISPECIES: diacylglycerol kinase family protein [unclassified Massilimicrobiota]MEE0777429.1 diacylglycerol kinase family protein [Massilimicrobiota sp.]NJE43710.1 diacylglycerol kinase family protein [Massilimicrobiota sp. SW1139]OUN35479.1 diacylglycerol kinase [Massilimicrobiota sp. An80]